MINDWNEKRRAEFLNYDKNLHLQMLNHKENFSTDELKLKVKLYSFILLDQLHWEVQSQYLELLTQFLEKEIEPLEFLIAFRERYKSIEKMKALLE